MGKKKTLWITIAVAVVLLVMGAVVIAKPSQAKVLPEGISFNGNSLAGLTPEKAKEKITEYMSYYNDRTIELVVGGETKTITMEELGLVIDGEEEALADLEEAIPYGNVFQRYKQEKDLEKVPVDIKTSVSYNEENLVNIVTEFVAKYEVAVAEPTYQKTATGFVTTSGATGIDYDETKIVEVLKDKLETDTNLVIKYEPESVITEPNVKVGTYDDLRADVLGTFTTMFDATNENRTQNIELGCSRLNGIVILPGEKISFLNQVKYDTKNSGGYVKAGTIVNGVIQPDIGGGLCQLATTVYDAVLYAELGVEKRNQHSLASTYVDYSWDAMVHYTGSDFIFYNNLDHPVYIEAGISRQGTSSPVTVTIYGTEYRSANRTVEYYTKVHSKKYTTPVYVVNRYTASTLPQEGKNYHTPRLYANRVVTATPKVSASLWKRVTVDGVVQSDTQVNKSTYKAEQGVMNLAWDMTMLYWIEVDQNGFETVYYEFRDGRYWDPSTETKIDLSKVQQFEWIGQNLNEDGSVYVPPTTEPPTTEPPTTVAPETTTVAPTTAAPETTTAAPTTAAPETTTVSPETTTVSE